MNEAANTIARNLRTLRERAGMKQEDLAAAMTARGFAMYQSTIYKLENIPPARKVSFSEGVAFAEVLGVSPDALLAPLGDEDELWERIKTAAIAVDEAVSSLAGSLSASIQKSQALAALLRSVPVSSLPLDREHVLVNGSPKLLAAMQELEVAIRKHGAVRASPHDLKVMPSRTSDNTINAQGEDGEFHDFDLDEWNAWIAGERKAHPEPLH